MSLGTQIVWLLVLAVPVACIAWTVTHEEVLLIFETINTERLLRGSSFIATL